MLLIQQVELIDFVGLNYIAIGPKGEMISGRLIIDDNKVVSCNSRLKKTPHDFVSHKLKLKPHKLLSELFMNYLVVVWSSSQITI